MKTKVNGSKVDQICRKLGFDAWTRVEAVGFNGGLWVLWNDNIQVEVIRHTPNLYA